MYKRQGKRIPTSWGLIQKRRDGFRILPSYEDPDADPDRKTYPNSYAMLGLQSALLGRVVPALRFVTADYDKKRRLFYFEIYYDGEVSQNLVDEWEDTIFETCADLGKDFLFEMIIERCDFPKNPIDRFPYYNQRFAIHNWIGIRRKNFLPQYNIITHEDSQKLLNKYALTGMRRNSIKIAEPGYQEIVNCKEVVGYAIDPKTGGKIPTTWIRINYLKNGTYIIPIKPTG